MSGKNDEEGIMNLGQSFQRSSQSPPMASRPPMSNPIFPIVFMIRRRPRSRPKQVVSRRSPVIREASAVCRVHNMNLAPWHREEE